MKTAITFRKIVLTLAAILLIAAGSEKSWGAAVNSDLEGDCYESLTKSIGKHISKMAKAEADCLERLYASETASCPDQKMTDTISKSRNSASKNIAKKCQGICSGPTGLSCISTPSCPPNGVLPELCSASGDFE